MLTAERKINRAMLDFMLEACRKGETMKVRFGRVLFSGASAAGKTNFCNLLLKKEFQPQHISTGLRESERVSAMKIGTQQSDNGVLFDKLDLEHEKFDLWWCLNTFTEQAENAHDDESDEEAENNDQYETLCTVERDLAAKNLSGGKNLPNGPLDKDEILNTLTFLDTGGQPQFINMLPAVNSCAMVTFIVHNMKNSLTSPVTVTHGRKDSTKSFEPYNNDCTNLQLIKSLISFTDNVLCGRRPTAIFSDENIIKGENKSYVAFIGTHLDTASQEDRNIMNKFLEKIIPDSQLSHVWKWVHKDYKYLIPVDNTTALTDDEDESAVVIRNKLYDALCEQNTYHVPIVWIILDLEIRQICQERHNHAISYAEVVELCREKKLLNKEDDIKNGLRFHHLFGTLLYFEEVEEISDIVFTDLQWLFDKLTAMVMQSYNSDIKASEDFEHKGIFRATLLKKTDFTIKEFRGINSPNKDFKEQFLKLLEHLKIIAPIKQPSGIVEKYFMPCLLKSCSFNQNGNCHHFLEDYGRQTVGGNIEVPPLVIQLTRCLSSGEECSAFPRGVFCCLVVELLQDDSIWELVWSNKTDEVFDNLVTLSYKNTDHKVTLMDKILFLEVQIRHENSSEVLVHCSIKKCLETYLKDICDRLNFYNYNITSGFVCTKCQVGDRLGEHVAKLSANRRSFTCRYGKSTKVSASHAVWFNLVCQCVSVHSQGGR